MFMAGTELDLSTMRQGHLGRAAGSWGASLVLALGVGAFLHATGLVLDSVVVALCLTTTALGTLLPILHDAGVLRTAVGPSVLSVGAIGEFGPIVAVAVLLTNRDVALTFLLLGLFVAVAVVAALLATQVHPPRFIALMRRHLHSTAQLPVRISVLLVILLVYLAEKLSLDVLLGAFAAGVVVRLFIKGEDSEPITSKLEAIGFGFLIPIFFIDSGIKFDLHALIHMPKVLLLVPVFTVIFLFTRGLPTWAFFRGAVTNLEARTLGILVGDGTADHRRHHVARCERASDEAAERGSPRRRRHALRADLPPHRAELARQGERGEGRSGRPGTLRRPVISEGRRAQSYPPVKKLGIGRAGAVRKNGRTWVSMISSTRAPPPGRGAGCGPRPDPRRGRTAGTGARASSSTTSL